MNRVQEIPNITTAQFLESVVPARTPVVLRKLVEHWDLVSLRDNSAEFARRLQRADSGLKCYTVVGSPEIEGRFFYGEGLQGTNFNKTNATVSEALTHISQQQGLNKPHAIAVQAAQLHEALPSLADSSINPLLPEIDPTFWLSNQSVVAPHYDLFDNIACVVHGKRRFTLFPPEQIANLYLGPTLNAPGGVPISTVDLRNPDLVRFPRFKQALEQAQTVELEPGDALYIPSPWWHAVESTAPLNLLINYWWSASEQPVLSANQSIMHSMVSIAHMPVEQRRAWKAFFDYLVFRLEDDPTAHLPSDLHDVVTNLTPAQQQQVLDYLTPNKS